jgi:hypothetical protein
MLALADLDTGFLVRADDKVLFRQRRTAPKLLVKIENGAGSMQELRVAGKGPAPMAPRTNSILAQPAPERDPADLRYEALPLVGGKNGLMSPASCDLPSRTSATA